MQQLSRWVVSLGLHLTLSFVHLYDKIVLKYTDDKRLILQPKLVCPRFDSQTGELFSSKRPFHILKLQTKTVYYRMYHFITKEFLYGFDKGEIKSD